MRREAMLSTGLKRFAMSLAKGWKLDASHHRKFSSRGHGYANFGSFMTEESVEAMVDRAAEEGEASRPMIPFPTAVDMRNIQFTENIFMLATDKFCFINHAAFGASLKVGELRAREWREYSETQPLRFFDRILFPHLVESARRIADWFNTSPRNIALVQNATAALNSVIASVMRVPENQKKKIIMFDVAYGSVKRMAHFHVSDKDDVIEIKVPFPLSAENGAQKICKSLEECLRTHGGSTALGIVDHISSNYAFVMPIQDLVTIFHKYNIPVLVDGAHGPNAIDINLSLMKCDFYVGNCHKWLSSPKSVGFIHVASNSLSSLKPVIISHGHGSEFPYSFYWDGCRDYAAALSLPVVLDVWDILDRSYVLRVNTDLANVSSDYLATSWNTSNAMLVAQGSIFSNLPMRLVPLPEEFGNEANHAFRLQQHLYYQYGIECPVKALEGRLYVRISSHIYNSIKDYEKLDIAIRMMKKPESGFLNAP